MVVQGAIPDRFAQVLAPLGDLEQAVDVARHRYAVEQIAGKVTELQPRNREFAQKYGCDADS